MLTYTRYIVIILLLLGTTTACAPSVQNITAARIVYGLTLTPSGFDPHIHQSSEIGIVLRQVYDTLIYRDPDNGRFVAGLAESWTLNESGTSYTFTLKQGVRFHDGEAFNAAAVAANLDRITDPATRSQNAVLLLGPYLGHEVLDTYTIRIDLSAPYAPLLDALSQVYLGIASPAALEANPGARYQFHQVGTGPYTFVEYIPDTRVVLRRNIDYTWGPDFYTLPQAPIEEVEFRFYSDPASRLPALESSEVDVMGEIPPVDARTLTGSGQLQLIPAEVGGQPDQFLMNTERFPTDNVVFRRSLIYAANRQIIADRLYQGFAPVAWGPLAERTQFYHPELRGLYNHDVQQARALLASVGYSDSDTDGYLDTADGPLKVEVLVPPWGEYREVAQLLQDQWREVGIQALLLPVPDFPSLIAAVQEGSYNLVAFNTTGLDPDFLSSYYGTEGSRNWTNFSSPDVDLLLTQAREQIDPNTRGQLYAQTQQLIMDQALVLPVRDRVNLNAVRSSVQGLTFDAYGWFPVLYNAAYIGSNAQ